MLNFTRFQHLVLASCFMFISVGSYAQESASETTASTGAAAPVPPAEPALKVSGFLDAYYQHSFSNAVFPTSFTPNNNSFSLGMANLVLARDGKVGFVADIAVGPRAEAANGYAGTALSFIKQLYVTYAATDALTFTLGNFSTHVGYEVIDSKTNLNYSTSYLFSYGPFFHTGAKANLALSDRFGVMLGVFNDTDTKIDVVSGKHLGAQFSYTYGNISAYLNYIGGRVADATETSVETTAHQYDLTASVQATEALGLGLNMTTKQLRPVSGANQSWSGAALYAKYAFSESFTLGMRGEVVQDSDGLILGIPDETITAFTISGNIHLGALTLIPELRIDSGSSASSFSSLSGKDLKTMSGVIIAAVYSF